jgi:hypothetical protein
MIVAVGLIVGFFFAAGQQSESGGAKVFIPPQPLTENSHGGGVRPFYYLTIVNPNGTEERVPASHPFASRSKAFLNVLPTRQGHLVVFVGDSSELVKQQVYDWARGARGDGDLVRDGENIKIPLTFDAKPGDTRLTVALIEEDGRSKAILEAIHQNSPKAAALLSDFLGGKGIDLNPHSDGQATVQPPVTYTRFSLHNQ